MNDLDWYAKANFFVHGLWQLFIERWLLVCLVFLTGVNPAFIVMFVFIWICMHTLHLQDLAGLLNWPSFRGLVFL